MLIMTNYDLRTFFILFTFNFQKIKKLAAKTIIGLTIICSVTFVLIHLCKYINISNLFYILIKY